MKIRNDFVSNSSSCSYVIAIDSSYDLEIFAKDIAKNCINSSSKYHDADLKKRNERILDFCLNTYELLFLGTWSLGSHEKVITKKEVLEIHGKKFGEEEWKSILDEVSRRKKNKIKSLTGRYDYVDVENECVHWFIDDIVYDRAVSKEIAETDFYLNKFIGMEDSKRKEKLMRDTKKRVFENLKGYAKIVSRNEEGDNWFSFENPETYQITKRTIENTRLLIEKGEKIKLEAWQNLDELEKRLDRGEKLCCLRVAHSGDGYGSYDIYEEDDREGKAFDRIAAEILTTEPL